MAERRLPKALLLILVILLVASTASAQIDSGKAATPGPAANRHADKTPLYSLSDPEVYLLRLADPPLASYRGEIRGLDATSPVATGAAKLDADAPASQAYLGYLAEKQNDVLDAMQPEPPGMDPETIRAACRGKLAFCGLISTQRTLPRGTVAECRAEARHRLDVIAKGGGYIFSPAHCIQPDTPLENVLAIYEEALGLEPGGLGR